MLNLILGISLAQDMPNLFGTNWPCYRYQILNTSGKAMLLFIFMLFSNRSGSFILPAEPSFFDIILFILIMLLGYGFFYIVLRFNSSRLEEPARIKDVACIMEQLMRENLGEREFSRKLLDFDQMTGGKLEQVLKVLILYGRNLEIKQLAYCWLTHKGYGEVTVASLSRKLKELKGLSGWSSLAIPTANSAFRNNSSDQSENQN
jgi:hypothetical protein